MKRTVEVMEDEEVLQTTTCTPRDIDKDPKGWKVAFRDELDSFDRLDVMDSVPLSTLDTSTLDILPCKVVMVKKPQGDGTHRKKGRVVVCVEISNRYNLVKRPVQIPHLFPCFVP